MFRHLFFLIFFFLTAVNAVALSPQEILSRNTRATIYLEVRNADGNIFQTGSGFIVSTDGFVITVAHIKVDPTQKLFAVIGQRSGTAFPLEFRDRDEQSDVALWKFPQSSVCRQGVALSGDAVEALNTVLALGYPGVSGLTPSNLSVVNLSTFRGFYKTDGFLEPGSSGGPVFNQDGAVIAIVHGGGLPGTENNELIPIAPAIDLMRKWNVSFSLDAQPVYPNECYTSCRNETHGIESWGSEATWGPVNSGWMGGGHNQVDECNKLMAAEKAKPGNQNAEIKISRRWEDDKKDWGRAEYKYWCEGMIRKSPVYIEIQSPACPLWN